MKRHRLDIETTAARIETVVEEPDGEPRALALIAHPHPLGGGSLDNKVAATLARAALASGCVAVRPNFRGVGRSSGVHDHGQGETADLLAVSDFVTDAYGPLPWLLLGFSFGAYVQHRVAQRLPARLLLMVGPAVSLYDFAPPSVPTHIIHGEVDELVPLAAVRAYADRHRVPLHVLTAAGHFFHGRLRELRELAEQRIDAAIG